MAERLQRILPAVVSPGLREVIFRDHFDFQRSEFAREAEAIVEAAGKVIPIAMTLPGNEGKTGFTLAITRRQIGTPIYAVQFGSIPQPDSHYPGGKAEKYAEYATLKAYILQVWRDFVASRQNSSLPEDRRVRDAWGKAIPGGAIAFGDWIIGGSGFPEASMDEAVVLATAFGSKVATYGQVDRLASDTRIKCGPFYEYSAKLLKPFGM